jgi:aspartate/methionine/tyrosine aminotransferase
MRGRPAAALHDLGGSDLRGSRATDDIVPDVVTDRPEPPAGVTVETLLATIYQVEPESVLVTAGASHANFLAAGAALEESDRDRAVVETPGYEPLVKTPEAFAGQVDRVPRLPEDDYRLHAETVAESIDESTALVTVTNRHNPSGRLADRDTLAEIASTTAADGARLLVDEVYAPYGPTDDQDRAFGGPTAAGLPNTIVTGSLTKFFGLGDVRIGWLIADPDVVDRARSILAHVPTVGGTNRAMARRILYDPDPAADRSRALIADHATELAGFLESHPALSGPVFEGSSFAFVGHEAMDGDAFARRAEQAGVLVVPGRFFGDSTRVRISLGRGRDDARAALTTLSDVLAETA